MPGQRSECGKTRSAAAVAVAEGIAVAAAHAADVAGAELVGDFAAVRAAGAQLAGAAR